MEAAPVAPTPGRSLPSRIPLGVKVGGACAAGGFVLGVLLTLAFVAEPPALRPSIQMVTARGGETVHLALSGRPVLAKAVLAPRPGRALQYRWDFGDDSDPVEGPVTDPYAVWATHTYPESPVGTRQVATLTVTDQTSGEVARGQYVTEVVEPTLENRITVALDDALWALHASMVRQEHPVHGSIGFWNERYYPRGSTAMAVLAFEVNGFDSRAGRADTPYRETVDRALQYILAGCETVELTEQPAGDPDGNGNGLGIQIAGSDRQLYELSLAAMALAASQDGKRLATSGPVGVIGRSLRDITQDMVDLVAMAQTDGEGGHRGGWRYHTQNSDADMSVTQWPVLALMSAEEVWGLEAPDWVRSELLEGFLAFDQGEHGGFGYTGPDDRVTTRLTGAGLISLAYAGVPSDDDRVQRAAGYIAEHWDSDNIGDYYAMYGIMKGAKLTRPEITRFGDHDWREEYADSLCGQQRPDGSWDGGGSYASGTLSTAWPALVLSRDIFFTARPLSLLWTVVIPGVSVLLVLLVVVLVLLLRRRASGPGRSSPP